ncbi:MAG: glycerol-3-phosphate dehydrogenase [Alphaproteobacteria bacterium PA2]|nr:MAG: glycerol-3-phosphate dehydrogenase [Alphaproteobacteria bacterium PA2]
MQAGALDFRNRSGVLDALDGASFDLLVIGGGVTGAGIARDAAMRGLSVALVEARDFAAGTSSRSSKMIHGGLRYMAQGDLGLVQEAASERKAVEAIAPHLTRMTPFVIPAKNAAAIAKLRTGLWAFEKLGGVPKGRQHEVWSRKDVETREPAIDASDLTGAVAYPEYLTEDAKLTLANVRAAVAYGATVVSYAPVSEILVENGKAVGVVLDDTLNGETARARITARVIVNAAGPWVDRLRGLEDGAAKPRLMLSKGVHLVVDQARLPVSRTIIMGARDKRSVFAVPKGRFTYIGTTDTFYPEDHTWPVIDRDDIDYLLEATNKRFSIAPLGDADIVAAWSGVRPLVGQEGKSASEISRKDEVWTGPAGILAIAGGKLTAYRRMAERVVDTVEELIGRKPTASLTATTPLPGGDLDVEAVTSTLSATMPKLEAERLVALYGSEAPLAAGGPEAETRHAVTVEGALKLEDVWVRRSNRAWFDDKGSKAALPVMGAEMATLLNWSPDRTASEIKACLDIRADSLSALNTTTAST